MHSSQYSSSLVIFISHNQVKKNFPVAEKEMSVLERLTRTSEVLDHRRLLCQVSTALDSFRLKDHDLSAKSIEVVKSLVSSSSDLRDIVKAFTAEEVVLDGLNKMFTDTCLSEISRIDSHIGPLVEFPYSVNTNLY